MGKDKLLPLGGKRRQDKGPNLTKKKSAAATKTPLVEDATPPQDRKGEFGDGSKMPKDWRATPQIIDKVVRQRLEICWAIALTRLLQAIFNISQTCVANCKEFSYDDLVVNLKLKKKGNGRISMKLQNLKDAMNHIAEKGLLKMKSSGRTKGGTEGFHAKWDFKMEKCPTAEFIRSKVDISPVVISFEIATEFQFIGNSIYKVRGVDQEDGDVEGHALLIVGYGYTKDGRLFFLVQNSWGVNWGVKGFGRIFIDAQSKTTLVYPLV